MALDLEEETMYITCESTWFRQEERRHNLFASPWYHGPIDRDEATKRVLHQDPGTFLVRASVKDKTAYAITCGLGGKLHVHIQIVLDENGFLHCEGRQFMRLHDVIEHYMENAYKGKVKLVAPCSGPAVDSYLFDEEDVYVTPAATAEVEKKVAEVKKRRESEVDGGDGGGDVAAKMRRDTVESIPLPDSVEEWDEANVQQWLNRNNDLKAFKKLMYANGVNGKRLLAIKAENFPKGKYSEQELTQFDAEMEKLRA
eukprot:UC1_evm1s1946